MNIYSFLSAAYDLMDVIWFSEKGVNPRNAIENAVVNDKCKVLDMCCGTFTSGYYIAKKNPENEVIGIDLSQKMLDEGMRKVNKAGLTNVVLKCADATDTKFPNNYFDYIVIGLVLHECRPELQKKILAEAGRILKDGGRLIVCEWEKQVQLYRKIKYAPLYWLEALNCKTFKHFYNCDKKKFFAENGFNVEDIKHCNYSCVIIMNKSAGS